MQMKDTYKNVSFPSDAHDCIEKSQCKQGAPIMLPRV